MSRLLGAVVVMLLGLEWWRLCDARHTREGLILLPEQYMDELAEMVGLTD